VILATPAGEPHVVALQMAGNLLTAAAYWILMLGANVRADALAACVRRHRPEVICLSATMPDRAGEMLRSVHRVRQELPAAQFVVGSRGLHAQMRMQPGIQLRQRVSKVVEAVDASVKRAGLN